MSSVASTSSTFATTTMRILLTRIHAINADNASTTVWRVANDQELTEVNFEPGPQFIVSIPAPQ